MTGNLSPAEVRALQLLRASAPHQFIAVFCGLPIEQVAELQSRQKARDQRPCQVVKEVLRTIERMPKVSVVQYKRVKEYVCPTCKRRVYLSPCVACTAKGKGII